MGKPTKQQIAEARKQGIVEGVVIESPVVSGMFGTVSAPSQWTARPDGSIVNGCGRISVRAGADWANVITPSKPKSTQPRTKGKFAAKPKEPTDRLKHIELGVNRHAVAIAMAIDRIVQRLNAIESSVAVIRAGASFMQQLEQDAPVGLKAGDYCDASKDVADELTAMGFKWADEDTYQCPLIEQWAEHPGFLINVYEPYAKKGATHLDAQTFLSRARVTAKELGLKPVEAPVQVWVPKVGDWVVCPVRPEGAETSECGWVDPFMDELVGEPMEVTRAGAYVVRACGHGWKREWLRPVTAEEVKAMERAEKLAALKFGVRVKATRGEGVYWKKVSDEWHDITFPDGWTSCSTEELTIL
jgi:hypothetical protein